MKSKLSLIIIALIAFSSCKKTLLEPEVSNDPITNFEELWKGYDEWYGLFDVKGVDWQSIHDTYRPLVTDQTSDAELMEIFHSMIDPLNDSHVFIITTENEPRIESGIFDSLKVQTDFSLDVVQQHYVSDFKHYGAAVDYGTLPGNVGYIHLGDFIPSEKFYEDALDQIFSELQSTNGIVIDIRDNPGGNDATAQYVAGRFAAERKLYMTTRKKEGPSHNDFTPPFEWYVEASGKSQYTKPIVLLTSRWTGSAGETFTLAMNQLSNVTQLGDYTGGAFSDNISRELPNGWFYFISIGDYRAADGASYEGIGIKPDVELVNSKEDILSGTDKELEKAMKLLQ